MFASVHASKVENETGMQFTANGGEASKGRRINRSLNVKSYRLWQNGWQNLVSILREWENLQEVSKQVYGMVLLERRTSRNQSRFCAGRLPLKLWIYNLYSLSSTSEVGRSAIVFSLRSLKTSLSTASVSIRKES